MGEILEGNEEFLTLRVQFTFLYGTARDRTARLHCSLDTPPIFCYIYIVLRYY